MVHNSHFPPTASVRPDRLLVVDADANTRQVIREALILAGYEIVEAFDGRDATDADLATPTPNGTILTEMEVLVARYAPLKV